VKAYDLAAAGTVAEDGAESLALVVVIVMGWPVEGAALTIVTVQILLWPACRVVGEQESDCTGTGPTVTVAVRAMPVSEAETVTTVYSGSPAIVPVKVAEAEPLGTVTEAGTARPALLLVTATADAEGVFCESVMAQVVELVPRIAEGVHTSEETRTERVRLKLLVAPVADAVIVAVCVRAESVPEVAVKLADMAPAGITTTAGTVRAAELLVRLNL
jgi:hypothetical protein